MVKKLLLGTKKTYEHVFFGGGYIAGVVGPHWPNQFLSLDTDFDAALRVLRVTLFGPILSFLNTSQRAKLGTNR